ncbi:MAG: FAD-dependent oxidoreductase, partial [Pseudomonadota bacterium]
MSNGIVIVGGGQAAAQTALSLRQNKFEGPVTLVSEEPDLPYQRPPLSKKYLSGELEVARLPLKPESFYDKAAVTLRLGCPVEAIDRENQLVALSGGERLSYDGLVLATGSRVRPLPGAEPGTPGVHYMRTRADSDGLAPHLKAGARMTLIGAGYIGLEVAAIARKAGMEVTVIERDERVLARVTAPEVSAFYRTRHEAEGVHFAFGAIMETLETATDGHQITLAGGTQIAGEVLVVGIGILPNQEIAAEAGIACDNGIIVDDRTRTNDPLICAAGDCTQHPSALYGRGIRLESVHNAIEQGKTAAATLCGKELVYDQVPWFWSDQYDLKLQTAGLLQDYDQTVLRG